jgi:uncharacterized SAM-binding protein YcdF (DUF218 family)
MTDDAAPIDDTEQPVEPSRSPRRWRVVLFVVLGAVGLGVVYFLVNLWLVHRTGASDQARPVDAIVVMGAAQYDGRPSPELAARLDQVVSLWNRNLAPLVITTGSNRPGDRFTESQASATYLEGRGVPAAAIEQVGGATSYDSLKAVSSVLKARGLHRVLLVSDPYHSLRIRLVSEELGLTGYVSPTRTSPVRGMAAFRRELKEAAGISVGRIIGFDRLLRLTG